MSIKYSTRLCYGMVVPPDIAKKIRERAYEFLPKNHKEYELFFNNYFFYLSLWGEGEEGSFLGFSTELEKDCCKEILIDDLLKEFYTLDNREEFYELYALFHLNDFIQWKPRRSIITFCY